MMIAATEGTADVGSILIAGVRQEWNGAKTALDQASTKIGLVSDGIRQKTRVLDRDLVRFPSFVPILFRFKEFGEPGYPKVSRPFTLSISFICIAPFYPTGFAPASEWGSFLYGGSI